MTKILSSVFFSNPTSSQSIGIVLTEEEYEGLQCFIGNCKEGTKKEEDERWIAEWGSTFPLKAAKTIFPNFFKKQKHKG